MSLEIRELIRPNLILNFPQETLSQGRTLGAWVAEQLALSSRDGLLSGLSGFLPSGRVLGSKVLPMAQEDLLRGHLVTWTYTSPWDQTRREQWKSFTLTWARLLTFSIVPLYANWSCISKLEMHFGQVYYKVHGKLTGLPVLKGCDCGWSQWLVPGSSSGVSSAEKDLRTNWMSSHQCAPLEMEVSCILAVFISGSASSRSSKAMLPLCSVLMCLVMDSPVQETCGHTRASP